MKKMFSSPLRTHTDIQSEGVIKVNWRDSNNIFHSYVAISDIIFRDGNVQFDSFENGTITVPINYISSITQR